MFAPMTPQNEYSRFTAETRERERRAAFALHAQPVQRRNPFARLFRLFSAPAKPAPRKTETRTTTAEHPAIVC